jgi:hypothetical protein
MEEYENIIVIKHEDMDWIVEHRSNIHELTFIGMFNGYTKYTKNISAELAGYSWSHYKYIGHILCEREFDDEIVFSILNDFSENILDHNIHTITFPNYTKKTNSISITKNNREIFLLECKKYKSDQLENAMIKSYLNHINATKKLLSRIDTLENTVEKFSNIVNDLLAIKNDCDNLDWRRETNKSEKLIS